MVTKAELVKRAKEKAAEARSLVTRDDYDDESKEKVNALLDEVNEIKAQLEDMCRADDAEVGDKEEDEKKEDEKDDDKAAEEDGGRSRSWNHPAIVRSRGRKSSDNIHEYAHRNAYSISRAAVEYRERGALSGVELETHQEIDRQSRTVGRGCTGHFKAPADFRKLNMKPEQRALNVSTGAGAVPTYWQDFVDYLYPIMVGPKLGYTYMDGLQATTQIPRLSGVPTIASVAESTAASGSNPTLDNVTLSPHALSGNVTISKLFALQSVVAADQLVMETLARQVGVKMDAYSLNGTGQNNQPTGLFNNSTVTNIQVATANAVAFADTIACEKLVANANALFGNLGWVTSPAGYAKLEQTPKIGSTFPVFLVNEKGEVNGNPCYRSTQVPSNLTYTGTSNLTALAFGAWQFLIVGTFGNGIDIIVDPLTGSTAGDLTITAFMYMDTNVMHPGAFATIPNVTP